jgi:hypothetical protein
MNKNFHSFQNLNSFNKNTIKNLLQKEIDKYLRPFDICVKKSFHYIHDIEMGKKSLNYIKLIDGEFTFIFLLEYLYAFSINIYKFLNNYVCNATFNSNEGLLVCDVDKNSKLFNFCIHYSDTLFEKKIPNKKKLENNREVKLVLSIHLVDVSEEYYDTFLDF